MYYRDSEEKNHGTNFLTGIDIKKVRHLENISIPLDKEKRKHLILTGKNGSGKTSVLEALVKFFLYITSNSYYSIENVNNKYKQYNDQLNNLKKQEDSDEKFVKINDIEKSISIWKEDFEIWNNGAIADINSVSFLQNKFKQGSFIFAYYKSERAFQVETYKNIEKIELQEKYSITENPGAKLTKYLVDLKAIQAFSKDNTKIEKIEKWFRTFENILKKIFEDDNLELKFDDETFQFSICATGREPFDFNTMSSGYAAVLDIINDLIIRMEAKAGLRTEFDMEGIVEGYFKADALSEELRKKFERYRGLVSKTELSDEEYEEIDKLEFYLDEIPDYLAKELTAEYSRLKLEFSKRG